MEERGDIIVVDVDDVVFDFVGPFLKHVRDNHPDLAEASITRRGLELTPANFSSYGLRFATGCDTSREKSIVEEFYGTSAFENLPVLDGAATELRTLGMAGKKTHVATSRPSTLADLTVNHFRRIGVPVEEYIFCNGQVVSNVTLTKGQVCARLRASSFVEDSANHIQDCLHQSPRTRPFLLSHPWNQEATPDGAYRAPDWRYIRETILSS